VGRGKTWRLGLRCLLLIPGVCRFPVHTSRKASSAADVLRLSGGGDKYHHSGGDHHLDSPQTLKGGPTVSKEKPNVDQIVMASLKGINGTKGDYNLHLHLSLIELWGTETVPDDIVVLSEGLSATNQLVVQDGFYEMEYTFGGKPVKKNVHIFTGRLTKGS
jgi:hypothetical protein